MSFPQKKSSSTRSPLPALPILPPGAELIDTHCHLDMSAYAADLETVLQAATAAGVRRIVTVGIDHASSCRALKLARERAGIFATVGIHPHGAQEAKTNVLEQLAALAEQPEVLAYGEIGLDYVRNYAPREVQLKAFSDQLALARELRLPVIIHDREAHEDCLRLLRQGGPLPAGGVMHCFSGDGRLAQEVLDLGMDISIPGVVTFSKAQNLREAIQVTPLSRLVLETDGPFLAPVPYRGKRNEPKLMLYTAQATATAKGISLGELAAATTANAVRLFRIPAASSLIEDGGHAC